MCHFCVHYYAHLLLLLLLLLIYEDHIRYRFCLITLKFLIDASDLGLTRNISYIIYTYVCGLCR